MKNLFTTTSRIALVTAILVAGVEVSTAQTISTPTTTGVTLSAGGTVTVTDTGSIVANAIAVGVAGGNGTSTIDNSGLIQSTGGTRTIEISGNGTSSGSPLTLIINNRATGIITNSGSPDVIRPTRNNTITVINNWGRIASAMGEGSDYFSGDAIDFQDKDGLGQTVNNYSTGVIEGAKHGITGDLPVTVNNDGTITGLNGSGINIDGGGVVVVNNGTISGRYRGYAEGDGDAIDVDGDLVLDNYGRVEGLGAGGFNGEEQNFADGLAIGGGTIRNWATGEIYGKGNGILADDSGGGATQIATDIYNEGLIEAADFDAIRLVGNNDDTVVNKGIIRAGANGKAIDVGGGNDVVSLFTGSTVEGLIDGGLGRNTVVLDGAGQDTLQSQLINFQELDVKGGRWSLSGRHDYEFAFVRQDATLVIDPALADLEIARSGTIDVYGRLEAAGDIFQTVTYGGTIAVAGDDIGTLTIEDYFYLGDEEVYDSNWNTLGVRNSVLEFTINAAGQSDMIVVTNVAGEASFTSQQYTNGGFEYGTDVKVMALAGAYEAETRYHLMHVDGEYDGNGFKSVDSNFAFLDATLDYVDNSTSDADLFDLYLDLVRNDVSFFDVAETPNQKAVAAALMAEGGSPLHSQVVPLSEEEANDAFDQLSGDTHASAASAIVGTMAGMQSTVDQQIDAAFAALGVNPTEALGYARMDAFGAEDAPGFNVWSQGVVRYGDVAGDGGATGYSSSTGALLIGADTALNTDWIAGIFGGYGRTGLEAADRDATADIDSFSFGTYAGGKLDAIGIKLGGVVSGHGVSTTRNVVFGGLDETLTADYGAASVEAFAEIGYELALTGALSVTPFLGLAYLGYEADGFTEDGGLAALTSDGTSYTTGIVTVGITTTSQFATGGGVLVNLDGTIAWKHLTDDAAPSSEMAFAGGNGFTVEGTPIAQDALVIGAGLSADLDQNLAIGARYDGQFADGDQSHGVNASLTGKF